MAEKTGLGPAMSVDLVIIGGTGLYELVPLNEPETLEFETPFGPGSAPFQIGYWQGKQVAFLARHGSDHGIAPHEVNYKANILACHELSPKAVIAINAVGSMNQSMPPTSTVLPDQIIDYTWGREHTFSGNLGDHPLHIDFTEPYSKRLRDQLLQANQEQLAGSVATYGATQGPRLETAAEIARMKSDGCDLVGMTGMPEAALARELEMEFASICLVANWAAGCPDRQQPAITIDQVLDNVQIATRQLVDLLEGFLSD